MPKEIARFNGNGLAGQLSGTNGDGEISLSLRIECQHDEETRLPTCRPVPVYSTLRVRTFPSEWTISQLATIIQATKLRGHQEAATNVTCTLGRLTEDERDGRGARSALEVHGGEHHTTLFLPHLPLDAIMELLALNRDDDFCVVLTSLARQSETK